jgi:UDP-3-O-[3-hydroxymyristoyl] glucosamine N-acyltransferase
LGHHNRIGKNSVIQRQSGIKDDNIIEPEVYIGLHSQIFGDHLTIAQGTVIHPCMAIRRSTVPDEVVSLAGKDLRKIYHLASFD